MLFYVVTATLAAWLLLEIDNPLEEWAGARYAAQVSRQLESEMRWNERNEFP